MNPASPITPSTICAVATAQGGAIAIIRISGPEAIAIADSLFLSPHHHTLATSQPQHTLFGTIVNPQNQEPIDEVLATAFRAPHSYTGEDTVEFSCHVSAYITQQILQHLIHQGCRMANPGEYTQRAFLSGRMDLSQAEAVADLIASQTAAAHRVALRQMRGHFSHRLHTLRSRLLEMTSLLELELDFSEEDVEFADRQKLITLATEIQTELHRLSASFATGNAIRNGIPVAIIGAPNVGKSTLLNQILGDDKAIVSDIQGTTRDTIEDTITIGGQLFRFIDTAGLRHTTDTIEQLGIQRSLQAAEKAQIIILITEPGVPYPDIPLRPDQHIIHITNKTDTFQALTGKGLDTLLKQLTSATPTPSEDEVLITNIRHKQALDLAHEAITRAICSLHSDLSGDLVSEDLRLCLTHLADILGSAITPDETLQTIFSKFCIGK